MNLKFVAVFAFLVFFSNTFILAQQPENSSSGDKSITLVEPDDKVSAMLDSLYALKIFNAKQANMETSRRNINLPYGHIPIFPESVYRERLQIMNDRSPMDFVYNQQVRSFIKFYAESRRGHTERMLGMAQLYFPFFEEQLDRYNLPLELKYLAVVESALNPTARSRAGATGIWQFMYNTGKAYGLEVNSFVDYRRDVIKATDAACRHLLDLYNIYEDWWLVLAAYNAGGGNVNRAIRRAGGLTNFWEISRFLPRETQNYVPTFIAVAYTMKHSEDHNLFAIPPVYSHATMDTIHVRGQLSLRLLSEQLEIPLDHLRFLNPTYSKNIIPFNEQNPYVLNLPVDLVPLFMANEETFYNFYTAEEMEQTEKEMQVEVQTITHVVRSGDVLGSIARRYRTTVREIQRLNNLKGTTIRVGQRLIIRGQSDAYKTESSPMGANTHVVKRGETLGAIAARYRITVDQIKNWNNLNTDHIVPGQSLIIRPPRG
jgi:membrane-bound lytic murein transglycosylase D